MHSRILTFHNLCRPHLDGDRDEQWVTFSHEDGMVYLLNGNRYELAELDDINIDKDIYFTTEAECHKQAQAYYCNYGNPYPFLKEWQACMKVAAFDNNVVEAESQVMEFI